MEGSALRIVKGMTHGVFSRAAGNMVRQFARLPGIGGKTAQRLAFHVLSLPEDAQAFADAIVTAKRTVTYCPYAAILPPGGCAPSVPLPRGITL